MDSTRNKIKSGPIIAPPQLLANKAMKLTVQMKVVRDLMVLLGMHVS
jgi:hypothetical protein